MPVSRATLSWFHWLLHQQDLLFLLGTQCQGNGIEVQGQQSLVTFYGLNTYLCINSVTLRNQRLSSLHSLPPLLFSGLLLLWALGPDRMGLALVGVLLPLHQTPKVISSWALSAGVLHVSCDPEPPLQPSLAQPPARCDPWVQCDPWDRELLAQPTPGSLALTIRTNRFGRPSWLSFSEIKSQSFWSQLKYTFWTSLSFESFLSYVKLARIIQRTFLPLNHLRVSYWPDVPWPPSILMCISYEQRHSLP